jgi:hypothetical protein
LAHYSSPNESQQIRDQGQQSQISPPPSSGQQKTTDGDSNQQPPPILVAEVLRATHASHDPLVRQFDGLTMPIGLRNKQAFACGQIVHVL